MDYLIYRNNAQEGPYSEEEVKSRLHDGTISNESFLWHEGLPDWVKVENIPTFSTSSGTKESPQDYVDLVSQSLEATHQLPLKNTMLIRRWLARFMDYQLSAFLVVIFVELFVNKKGFLTNKIVMPIVTVWVWCVIEPIFLSTLGYTPFKGLFGIKVRERDGSLLKYRRGLNRTSTLTVEGVGLGVPFVQTIMGFLAYRKVKQTGVSDWDKKLDCLVGFEKLGKGRIAIIVLILFGWFSATALLKTMEAMNK